MKIGFVATRLAGTDGVSLETKKWAEMARRLGHEVYLCAGQVEEAAPDATLIPELHFQHPEARAVGEMVFGRRDAQADLKRRLDEGAAYLEEHLRAWLGETGVEVLVVENALAIPMHLALGLALTRLIRATGIPSVGHHHDFYWERERFQVNCIPELLNECFPPDLPSLRHVTINSLARRALARFRGLEADLVPNVFDYETPAPRIDDYNRDLPEAIGLAPGDLLFLQPTRIVPRKGIELALELVHRLDDPRVRLAISHAAGDEGMDYYAGLQRLAVSLGLEIRHLAGLIEDRRTVRQGQKRYTLWDVYPHADFVTYPSLYEGFGNALLEAVYFLKPLLVNRYEVYAADIAPLGFRFVEIDGRITSSTLAEVRRLLDDGERWRDAAVHNYELARRHFSYEVLARALERLLGDGPGR
ncbi:MAG: glycosyltransferase family 4 protein [Anaerolineae bacterium]|jgi:glycosyltransferase involved in cell wall biosynthesis|nr:glycosyltransferase family 4 protein [Anaerolineae bacterium]MDX9830792.1 glycosyltransferase family 4 protein [Anaerolineae bacterium]